MKVMKIICIILLGLCTSVLPATDRASPEEEAKSGVIQSQINELCEAFGDDDVLPELYKLLEENIGDRMYVEHVVSRLQYGSSIPTVEANPGILKIMRKVMDVHKNKPPFGAVTAISYLQLKGDASDMKRLPNDTIFKARVAGTNLFGYVFHFNPDVVFGLEGYSSLRPPFIPSVSNTGPQALYVYEILKRFWEQSDQDSSRMPEELLTMVVFLDANGNPMCSVDLAKYGLSMPILEPKPQPRVYPWREGFHMSSPYIIPYTVTFPHETENTESQSANATGDIANLPTAPPTDVQDTSTETPSSEQSETTSCPKSLLWLGIGILAVLLIGFLAWWKQGQKNL